MIDLCYQNFDMNDISKIFGVSLSSQKEMADLKKIVDRLFEQNTIDWKILPDNQIFRRTLLKEFFQPEPIIEEMIEFVQLSERIY